MKDFHVEPLRTLDDLLQWLIENRDTMLYGISTARLMAQGVKTTEQHDNDGSLRKNREILRHGYRWLAFLSGRSVELPTLPDNLDDAERRYIELIKLTKDIQSATLSGAKDCNSKMKLAIAEDTETRSTWTSKQFSKLVGFSPAAVRKTEIWRQLRIQQESARRSRCEIHTRDNSSEIE